MNSLKKMWGGVRTTFGQFGRKHRGWAVFSIFAAVLLGTVGPVVANQLLRGNEQERHEPSDIVKQRSEWFYRPRASANGHIPNSLRLQALAERDARIGREGTMMSRGEFGAIIPSATTWTPIGPRPLANEFFFGNVSGRVNAVAIDPCDNTNKTVYIGAANGGVWRTADGGTTWTPLTDTQPSLSSGSLALVASGTNCAATTVYYGTGEENFAFDSVYGAGVLTSTNAGGSWTADSTFHSTTPQGPFQFGPFIGSLSVQPGNSNPSTRVLLAGIQGSGTLNDGIYRSADGGVTWTLHNPASPRDDFATGIAFDPNDATGKIAFAAMGFPGGDTPLVNAGVCTASPCNGLFKSADSGVTWTRVTSLDAAVGTANSMRYGRITFAIGPSTPANDPTKSVIYAVAADAGVPPNFLNSAPLLGGAKSIDGGATWTVAPNLPKFCNNQCFYDIALAVDPKNAQIVFAGGGAHATGDGAGPTLIRSTDGGTTWADVSADGSGKQIHVDHHAITISPDETTVYIGNDGGVWKSTDVLNPATAAGSQHWTDLNSDLQITQFYGGMAAHPTQVTPIFGGTQDNGTQIFGGSFAWTDTGACGDGGYNAIDPTSGTPFTVYVACTVANSPRISKSTTGGAGGSFVAADGGINFGLAGQSADFIPPFVIDAKTPSNIYYGTNFLWQSQNGGGAWTQMQSGPAADLTLGGGDFLEAIAVAPSDSKTVYVASANANGIASPPQVEVSTNANLGATATFTSINGGGNLPFRTATQVAVDPNSATTAYITFSGFSGFGDPTGHIFKTTTGAAPWTNIDGNLPNVPVNDLVIDPTDATGNTLYAGTDVGVFGTTNGGTTWSTVATGLPNDQVMSLKIQASGHILIAGTHGRGVFELQLAQAATITSINPTSAQVGGAAAIPLTVTGTGFSATSIVNFNGTPLATNATGQPTTLTATIPTTDLTTAGTFPITVTDNGATSNSVNFAVNNPTPTLTAIAPNNATAGGAAFTLTATGTGFVNGAVINFGSTALTTTFVSATSLTGAVPASAIAAGANVNVTVTNPAPPANDTSGSQPFTVNNPAPTLATINPTSAVAGGPAFTLTLNGTGFIQGASGTTVNFGTTTGIAQLAGGSATAITATIPAAAIAATGNFNVTVTNPTPGGGTSGTQPFAVQGFTVGTITSDQTNNTFKAGTTVTFTVPVTSTNGFNAQVALACSGNLPTKTTCGTGTVTPPANGTANGTVTLMTTANTMLPGGLGSRKYGPPAMWLLLAATILLAFLVMPRIASPKRRLVFGMSLATMVLMFAAAGCGSSSSSHGPNGTPPGNYTVTISATSGGAVQNANVNITVQ